MKRIKRDVNIDGRTTYHMYRKASILKLNMKIRARNYLSDPLYITSGYAPQKPLGALTVRG